jgi:hypothetical protein
VGALTAGDVVCLAIDHPNQRLWFRKNGGNWNNSGTANPATNIGGFNISAVFTATNTFALVTFASTGLNHTANFGAATFAQTMPSGFSAWNSGAT